MPSFFDSRYHDGMIATRTGMPEIMMRRLFYPKWWLQVCVSYSFCVQIDSCLGKYACFGFSLWWYWLLLLSSLCYSYLCVLLI